MSKLGCLTSCFNPPVQIPTCTTRSNELESGASHITNFIKSDTSPEQFDAERQKYPNYKLTYGGRCGWNALCAAAEANNVALIEHIVRIGGSALLELGNSFGMTPLLCAVFYKKVAAARKLIELRAEVNIAISEDLEDIDIQIPKGSSPLSIALKTNQAALVRILAKNGAKTLNRREKQAVKKVQKIRADCEQTIAQRIPLDLAKITADYQDL